MARLLATWCLDGVVFQELELAESDGNMSDELYIVPLDLCISNEEFFTILKGCAFIESIHQVTSSDKQANTEWDKTCESWQTK